MQQVLKSSVRSGTPQGYTLPQGGTVAHQDGGTFKGAIVNKDEIRFWSKVNKDGPIPAHVPYLGKCWEWKAATFRNGYALFSVQGKSVKGHRWIYEQTICNIPTGNECCHKCDNRKCVRPDHLFHGTRSDNMLDCVSKGRWRNQEIGKTHCNRGHELTGNNLRLRTYPKDPSKGIERSCRACAAYRMRVKRANAKAGK